MRNKLYSERIELSVTPEQKFEIVHVAGERRITVNQLLREVIEEYLS